jgi:hypothetical protein
LWSWKLKIPDEVENKSAVLGLLKKTYSALTFRYRSCKQPLGNSKGKPYQTEVCEFYFLPGEYMNNIFK